MNKITATERVVKDLMFLKGLPSKEIAPGIIKRVDVEGNGETIKEIKLPCSKYVYHSLNTTMKVDLLAKSWMPVSEIQIRNRVLK